MPDVREKLVELLKKTPIAEINGHIAEAEVCFVSHVFESMADHLIAHGVTIQRWIPVTERLPEDDLPKGSKVKQIKVIVAYRTNGRWVVRTQTRVKGHWYGAPDEWDWIRTGDPITHWKPMPQPPKGDNNG